MSEKHLIVCDMCKRSIDCEYNGEHWLPPKSWAILVDNEFRSSEFDMHICPECVIKIQKQVSA